MHELAITQSIVDMVAERVPDREVVAVHVTIGRISGVLPEAVRFCFDLVAAGTPVEGATLRITEPPGLGRCRSCGLESGFDAAPAICECGATDVEVLGGDELTVTAVELA
jgi:hydrogenase nickel incorporation protein HypA/HybF